MALRRAVASFRGVRQSAVPARTQLQFDFDMPPEKLVEHQNARKKMLNYTRSDLLEFAVKYQEDRKKPGYLPPNFTGSRKEPMTAWLMRPLEDVAKDPQYSLSLKETLAMYDHPFVRKRMAEVSQKGYRDPDLTTVAELHDEFMRPLNPNTKHVEAINAANEEYIDDLHKYMMDMVTQRCPEDEAYCVAMMKAFSRTKGLRPGHEGRGYVCNCLELMYDMLFSYKMKPTQTMWNTVLLNCTVEGDWKTGYFIEDVMRSYKMTPDQALLDKIDEIAFEACDKGYVHPIKYDGADITGALHVRTVGGVGAYVQPPQGESWGFCLWEQYEKLRAEKKRGVDVWRDPRYQQGKLKVVGHADPCEPPAIIGHRKKEQHSVPVPIEPSKEQIAQGGTLPEQRDTHVRPPAQPVQPTQPGQPAQPGQPPKP